MARVPSDLGRRVAHLRLPLHGRRIDLAAVGREHLPELVLLLNDASVARWTLHIPHPYTVAHARWWMRKSSRDRQAGLALGLLIVRRGDNVVVGGVGLHQLHPESGCAEVGYWLGKPFRGQGYATEAVNLMLRTGFDRLRLHRIEALVFPRNRASQRVLRRCGFRYEGTIRDEARKDGRWISTRQFSRLASDAPVARQTPRRTERAPQARRRR